MDALERNGWKRTSFEDRASMDVYTNEGWPDCKILTGGGFSIQGDALRNHPAYGDIQSGGGDYKFLHCFLDSVGPKAP